MWVEDHRRYTGTFFSFTSSVPWVVVREVCKEAMRFPEALITGLENSASVCPMHHVSLVWCSQTPHHQPVYAESLLSIH